MLQIQDHYYQQDYLHLHSLPSYPEILHKRQEYQKKWGKTLLNKMNHLMQAIDCPIGSYQVEPKDIHIHFKSSLNLSSQHYQILRKIAHALIPWRLGPWQYDDLYIESEWNSYKKWEQFQSHIHIENKIIADIGANNTYYSYLLSPQKPQLILSFDPIERYYYHFYLNQYLAPQKNLAFETFSVYDLVLFPLFFDIILCLGVLYHRKDPLGTLESIHAALQPHGLLILETMTIDTSGPYCLFPLSYMKSHNNYFIPSPEALTHMLLKTGFKDIHIITHREHEIEEQKKSQWSPGFSLNDFIHPLNPQLTSEGYPLAYRTTIKAYKK